MKETAIANYGLYIVDDRYFDRFPTDALVKNKSNARPNYFAFMDKDGICWMIPLSTQVAHYRAKLAVEEQKCGVGNCLYFAFAQIAGIERVVLTGNIFPVTAEYILRPYEINGIAYVLRNQNAIKEITQKAKRYLKLIEAGKIQDRAGILEIKAALLADRPSPAT